MIDFHCHLDLLGDPFGELKRLEASRAYVLSVTTTPRAFPKTARLAKNSERVRTALGLHPQLVGERWRELSLLETLLPETRYIGEVGLDGGKEFSESFGKQKDVFQSIVQMCSKRSDSILSIHSRHAATQVLDCLELHLKQGTPVLHWFTGTAKELDRAIELGCWFSVGVPMLKSKKGVELIKKIPENRILTETDAPFTGNNTLASIKKAEVALGEIWGVSSSDASTHLVKNLSRLVT